LKPWKIASSIAAGTAVVSVIAVVLFYSVPMNPCAFFPFQAANANLVYQTGKELYDGAELVVIVRITESNAKCEGSQIWTHMQIEVEDSAKNPNGIKFLTAKSYGGTIGGQGLWVEDSPIFKKGDRAFLYLYKDKPDDTIYRISPYSGTLSVNDSPDETVTAKEILRTFRLQSVTSSDSSTIDIPQGSNQQITLTFQSFFGYDSPTNITMSSFTYYNNSDGTVTSEYADMAEIKYFRLSVKPNYTLIQPVINGTTQVQFAISASDKAVLGLYDIRFSTTTVDEYSYLAGGGGETLLRINVTGDAAPIRESAIQPEGISLFIEPYGRREFYQDENAGVPGNLTISNASAFSKEATISWPSIGPNCVITKPSIAPESNGIVFDYYRSMGIDGDHSRIQYDESVYIRELEPPPAVYGRASGCDWNQTNLDGEKVEPGTYQVILTIPVLIEEQGHKEIITLASQTDSFTIIEGRPATQMHNLILEYRVNNTNLLTGEPYSFSLYLMNNGNQTESFTIDHNTEEGSCYWRHTGQLEHPDQILPRGGRIDLAAGNNIGYAPARPGLYPYTPFVMLSIDESERVECLKIEANTVTLNVTAPVYEGIKLVITTDKQVYKRNETVTISLYIENDSDRPFKLQEVHPSISIRDDFGREVYGTSWIVDYSVYPTVEPHSSYDLTSVIPVNWDQTAYLEGGSSEPAESGEYVISATFTYPYLKSEKLAIWIED